jgi:hypothetical protein
VTKIVVVKPVRLPECVAAMEPSVPVTAPPCSNLKYQGPGFGRDIPNQSLPHATGTCRLQRVSMIASKYEQAASATAAARQY